MTRRNGRISSTKSQTRSDALRGRPSKRTGQKNVPRSAQVVGLIPRPKPDPTLRPWPSNCVQIVAATPERVNVRGIRGKIVDHVCAECQCRLAVDSFTIQTNWDMPERQRRPLRFICVQCCVSRYDRNSISLLIDQRNSTGNNEGIQLDE
jgi:hypothetical protein